MEVIHGRCVGGPLNGEIRFWDGDYFDADNSDPPQITEITDDPKITNETFEIVTYRKATYSQGVYQWRLVGD